MTGRRTRSVYHEISKDKDKAMSSFSSHVLAVALLSVGTLAQAAPGDTELVSIRLPGQTTGDRASNDAQISANGRYVAFTSAAPDLVAGDTNGYSDVFVRDLQTGTTQRVSVRSDGGQADRGGGKAGISADGRFVSFTS